MSLALSALALWLCLPAGAAAEDDQAVTFRSRAYEITTTLDREMALAVAEHVDLVHAYYTNQFAGFRSRQLQQHPLHVFARRQEYLDFLAEQGINGAGSGGMFFVTRGGSGLATFLEGQGVTRMLRTLRHEGFHQFAYSKIGPTMPQWVNEGLAEYFADSIVVGDRFSPGQVSPAALHNVQTAIEEDRYLAFEELLNLSGAEWGRRVRAGNTRLMYDQSWSIVHFLVHADQRYTAAFNQYLVELGRGQSSQRAFDRAFQSPDYAAFEQAWKQYVRQLEPSPETTAETRLTFLGEGVRLLQERGVSVDSVASLREELQRRGFRMRMSLGHGLTLELTAEEEENFEAPDAPARRGVETRLEMLPAAGDLPPGLVVRGMRHTVRLTWQEGPEGEAVSQIVYE